MSSKKPWIFLMDIRLDKSLSQTTAYHGSVYYLAA